MSCVDKLGIQSVQWAGTDKSLNRIFELITSNGIDAALRREEETLYIDTYIQEYRESNDKYGKTYRRRNLSLWKFAELCSIM